MLPKGHFRSASKIINKVRGQSTKSRSKKPADLLPSLQLTCVRVRRGESVKAKKRKRQKVESMISIMILIIMIRFGKINVRARRCKRSLSHQGLSYRNWSIPITPIPSMLLLPPYPPSHTFFDSPIPDETHIWHSHNPPSL